MTATLDRDRLGADCARCLALCCVAPSFTASADFAIDKPAGVPCPNLGGDNRCGIHGFLREHGFPGCAAYDCFGAGQRVTASAEGRGRTPGLFDEFAAMRQRHERLWYLAEAAAIPAAEAMRGEVQAAAEALDAGTLDVAAADALLDRVATLARGGPAPSDRAGADLIGRDLRRVALRAADLRGAYLIGADLRRADLTLADMRGADLRGADVRGARLDRTLFLTHSQLGAANGDQSTRLPGWLERPAHWLRHRER